jgi:DNA polymerase epsilon subunit 1
MIPSASIRLGGAASSEGPTNNLFSARIGSQLHANGRNRSTFFQKQELSLFRSHWQVCNFPIFIILCERV